MKAGRELDAYEKWAEESHAAWMRRIDVFVAEKVMGFAVGGNWEDLPEYSTQIADAWLVLKKLEYEPYTLHRRILDYNDGSLVSVYYMFRCTIGPASVEEITAPLAICLSALKAME